MATGKTNGTNVPATLPFEQRSVKYRPLAEAQEIEISVGMVTNILAVRSRSGRAPESADIMKFMMLCKSRALNPFTGDAYLLGYDNAQDGTTNWSLITAIQALRKRAEANPQYDGCRHGIVILVDGAPVEREGALLLTGEQLVGGWADVYRKDRAHPSRAVVKFSVYDTGRSRWKKDPSGMISKVAEAAALREAFPSDLAGLYVREEFEGENDDAPTGPPVVPSKSLDDLAARLTAPRTSERTTTRDEAEVDRQDVAGDVDQRGPEDDGNQDNPAGETAEERRDRMAEDREPRTTGTQKSAFDTAPEYDRD